MAAAIPNVRSLTAEERCLLEWLLTPRAAEYMGQMADATVVSRCSCGCPTIDLAVKGVRGHGRSDILADVAGISPEGVRVGVFVHAREGLLSELEVYSITGDEPYTLPRIEDLS